MAGSAGAVGAEALPESNARPLWSPTPAFARAVVLGTGALAVGLALGLPDVAVAGVPLALLAVDALRGGVPVRWPARHHSGSVGGGFGSAGGEPSPARGGRGPTDAGLDLAGAPPARPLASTRAPRFAEAGEQVPVRITIDDVGADLVTVRLPVGTTSARGSSVAVGPGVAVSTGEGPRVLRLTVPVPRWGPVVVARPDALAVRADGMLVLGPVRGAERAVTVLPVVEPAAAGPLPPHPTSVVGRHPTRRAGEGAEPAGIDPFRPGDRLRRIHWGVTARRHATSADPDQLPLHVRRGVVDAEGEVALLLDTRLDVGRRVAEWSAPPALVSGTSEPGSSLDATVTAALALAAAHLSAGDRVSVVDLAAPRRGVPAGSGRRQLARIRLALAMTQVSGDVAGPLGRARSHGDLGGELSVPARAARSTVLPAARPAVLPAVLLARVPPRTLAVVLSPFLDARTVELAAALQRHGRAVLGVDTLPVRLEPDLTSAQGEAALRLLLAERQERLAALAVAGVPVLSAGVDLVGLLRRLVWARERWGR